MVGDGRWRHCHPLVMGQHQAAQMSQRGLLYLRDLGSNLMSVYLEVYVREEVVANVWKYESKQRMNNHRFDTKHKDLDKPVPIHASTHNQDFQTCYTTKILRAFPKQCNSSQLRQWELAHQWITKSRLPPGLNRR
uniref:Uncharacterized protein n=1 Tax=Timema monikensis TaxID=170555 RepID=A0A7R9EF33_9NEOP|nr:unnamed protein product [Timema monikensis]